MAEGPQFPIDSVSWLLLLLFPFFRFAKSLTLKPCLTNKPQTYQTALEKTILTVIGMSLCQPYQLGGMTNWNNLVLFQQQVLQELEVKAAT